MCIFRTIGIDISKDWLGPPPAGGGPTESQIPAYPPSPPGPARHAHAARRSAQLRDLGQLTTLRHPAVAIAVIVAVRFGPCEDNPTIGSLAAPSIPRLALPRAGLFEISIPTVSLVICFSCVRESEYLGYVRVVRTATWTCGMSKSISLAQRAVRQPAAACTRYRPSPHRWPRAPSAESPH